MSACHIPVERTVHSRDVFEPPSSLLYSRLHRTACVCGGAWCTGPRSVPFRSSGCPLCSFFPAPAPAPARALILLSVPPPPSRPARATSLYLTYRHTTLRLQQRAQAHFTACWCIQFTSVSFHFISLYVFLSLSPALLFSPLYSTLLFKSLDYIVSGESRNLRPPALMLQLHSIEFKHNAAILLSFIISFYFTYNILQCITRWCSFTPKYDLTPFCTEKNLDITHFRCLVYSYTLLMIILD